MQLRVFIFAMLYIRMQPSILYIEGIVGIGASLLWFDYFLTNLCGPHLMKVTLGGMQRLKYRIKQKSPKFTSSLKPIFKKKCYA